LQFAVAAGATVIATSSSDEKLKIASKLGAKHVINYNKTPNWDEEVKKIVRPSFYELSSIMVSNLTRPTALAQAISSKCVFSHLSFYIKAKSCIPQRLVVLAH